MTEFLQEAIQPANLPATVLLGLVLLYWLLMIFGIFHLDADVDVDLDADVDTDLDGHVDGGVAADVLTFFHLGEVPVMILASFFVLFFWVTTMISNHYFNPNWSFAISLYALIPSVIVSLILTKLAVMPLTPLFKAMQTGDSIKVVGSRGRVSTSELTGSFGQVSIEHEGPPTVINAITENSQRLLKNQEVQVVRFVEETGVYIVEPVKPEKD
ncbi:MAG: hypothetical protein ACR2NP_18455 [Pirellulaceae bacterium]